MALITCPECGRRITDKAEHCIGCGLSMELIKKYHLKKLLNDRSIKCIVCGTEFNLADCCCPECKYPALRFSSALDIKESIDAYRKEKGVGSEEKEIAEKEEPIPEKKETDSSAGIEATEKIDKFYTLYRKNEEFQRFLDEEYNKLKSTGGPAPEPIIPDEPAVQNKGLTKKAIMIAAGLLVVLCIVIMAVLGNSDPVNTDPVDDSAGSNAYGEGFVFKQGFDQDYPPYSNVEDDGTYSGFDVELAQAVCELNGWEYEGVPINWDEKEAQLNSGNIDCIWSGFVKNIARKNDYSWSDPYLIDSLKIIIPEGSSITSSADLAGKKIGVQNASEAMEKLETSADILTYDTYSDAIRDLRTGAVDAVASMASTVQGVDMNGLAFLDEDIYQEEIAVAFRTGDTELRDIVNRSLKTLAANGTIKEIGKKYTELDALLSATYQ